jgi:hypothetical protein
MPEDAELPGVDLDGTVLAEIPGVDTDQEQTPDHESAQVEPGATFDLGRTPDATPDETIPQTATQSESAEAPVGTVCQPVRRSTCLREAVKSYVPSMQGKRYSFAMTQLGHKLLDNVEYWHDPRVALCFMEQLSAKAALKKWGKDAEAVGEKETSQLHWQKPFVPK